jgi:hypothetical protein
MSRFDRVQRYQQQAEDHTKMGGDPQKALAFALLAISEAIVVTEPDNELDVTVSGRLGLDVDK